MAGGSNEIDREKLRAEVRKLRDDYVRYMLDEGRDDVIFFADEGGSWHLGVDWAGVLPAWFKVLSVTAGPGDFAKQITALPSRHCSSLDPADDSDCP